MTGTLTAYQARLRSDGHHAIQLRFTVEMGDALQQRENIGEYCDLQLCADPDPATETIELSAVFNGYTARVREDETVFVLGFLASLTLHAENLKRALEHLNVPGILLVNRSQQRLPWAKEDDAAADAPGDLF